MSGQTAAPPGPCLILDQRKIDAPDFPRPQAWWDHFRSTGRDVENLPGDEPTWDRH